MIGDIVFFIGWALWSTFLFRYIITDFPFYIRISTSLFFGVIMNLLIAAGIIALKDLSWIDWKLLGEVLVGILVYVMIIYMIHRKDWWTNNKRSGRKIK